MPNFAPKRLGEIQNGQNWVFQIFSYHFGVKNWKKFRTAKIGHSEFFQTILVQVQRTWKNLGMAKIGHSEFFPTIFVQRTWKNLGMAKIGHSKFFPTILGQKKMGRNLEKCKAYIGPIKKHCCCQDSYRDR